MVLVVRLNFSTMIQFLKKCYILIRGCVGLGNIKHTTGSLRRETQAVPLSHLIFHPETSSGCDSVVLVFSFGSHKNFNWPLYVKHLPAIIVKHAVN